MILIEIEENFTKTIPSCKDSAATIVTKQIPRTRKGVGTACPAFLKEIRTLFPQIPESGGDEKHLELCLDASQSFRNLALFSVCVFFRANVT